MTKLTTILVALALVGCRVDGGGPEEQPDGDVEVCGSEVCSGARYCCTNGEGDVEPSCCPSSWVCDRLGCRAEGLLLLDPGEACAEDAECVTGLCSEGGACECEDGATETVCHSGDSTCLDEETIGNCVGDEHCAAWVVLGTCEPGHICVAEGDGFTSCPPRE